MSLVSLLSLMPRTVAGAHRRYSVRQRIKSIDRHIEHIRRERANGMETERELQIERMNLKAELRGL